MRADLFLLRAFELIPLLALFLNLLLVLHHQLLLPHLKVLVNLVNALLILDLEDTLLLIDFLLSLSLDEWVITLGSKDGTLGEDTSTIRGT